MKYVPPMPYVMAKLPDRAKPPGWVHFTPDGQTTFCGREVTGSHPDGDNGRACRTCYFRAKSYAKGVDTASR